MSPSKDVYGGRYEVLGRAGAGGMAEVYRARDELLGREVALKVLSERFAHDSSFIERFRREAQSAANLSHPNIVSLYDYGSDDGSYFIVMEYIDGQAVSEIIASEAPLLPERAADIASDVAGALQRAHTAGLVHRDIKPGNIMITSNGQTKVTDFGIARALGHGEQTMTQTGMVIGTASYLSPEQAQGNPVDARSDVYSLGCVLYEMLTGRVPFAGDTPLSIAYKHVREEAQPPSRLNPDVPAELDAITLKALAKNPDNRYDSASKMQEDLQRFLSGQKVLATPLLNEATTVAAPVGGTEVLRRPDTAYPAQARGGRGAGFWILLSLLILALFGLVAWALFNNLLDNPPSGAARVQVPALVGEDVARARALLEERGLESTVTRRASAGREENTVLNQDPRPGVRVERGSEVALIVSSGAPQTDVPGLRGESLESATQLLQDAGLRLGGQEEQASDDFDPGIVIDQSPQPGERVDEGSAVDVVVSSGPENIVVPSVIGATEEEARAELEAAGLGIDVATEPNDEFDEGRVFAQDPAEGAEVEPDTVVAVLISEGSDGTELPDLTGQDADDAQSALEDQLGVEVNQEETDELCTQEPGAVCGSDPEPGTVVSEGDEVTLFVQPDPGD